MVCAAQAKKPQVKRRRERIRVPGRHRDCIRAVVDGLRHAAGLILIVATSIAIASMQATQWRSKRLGTTNMSASRIRAMMAVTLGPGEHTGFETELLCASSSARFGPSPTISSEKTIPFSAASRLFRAGCHGPSARASVPR